MIDNVYVLQVMGAHKVLVLGSGSREHAIACKLLESDNISHVFVCPGNAGMTKLYNISLPCKYTLHSLLQMYVVNLPIFPCCQKFLLNQWCSKHAFS